MGVGYNKKVTTTTTTCVKTLLGTTPRLPPPQYSFIYLPLVLNMGRKDAQMPSLPVDNYRKQIGKQNKRQTTTTVKDLKKHTESKSSSSKVYQDIKMVVGGFAAVVILVYCLLFLWLFDQKNVK
nr:triple QxxK/R motif-containing protein-like isoform X1 [Procambarus clarkii]